jgi:hypothetical protein
MSKLFAFVLMVSTMMSTPVLAETLNGQVSSDVTAAEDNTQPKLEDGTASADDDAAAMRGLRIDIHQGKMPRIALSEFVALMKQRALEGTGGTSKTLQGGAAQQLSAIGVWFAFPTGIVKEVDPASDLNGKVVVGDRILAINGMTPIESAMNGSNYGNAGTLAQVTFSHEGTVQTLSCKRQPITFFQPQAQSILSRGPHSVTTE